MRHRPVHRHDQERHASAVPKKRQRTRHHPCQERAGKGTAFSLPNNNLPAILSGGRTSRSKVLPQSKDLLFFGASNGSPGNSQVADCTINAVPPYAKLPQAQGSRRGAAPANSPAFPCRVDVWIWVVSPVGTAKLTMCASNLP